MQTPSPTVYFVPAAEDRRRRSSGSDLPKFSTPFRNGSWRRIGIYLALAFLTWSVFSQAVRFQFIEFDDQNYVYQNPRITAGLTVSGLVSAFTEPHAQNWHPLTTISHMIDCQLWGIHPAGHHLTNVLLHIATVLLLFSVLYAVTGATWRSAVVAALFAIHPLRAESVAWISERKDVLSGVLFLLTIGAYVAYIPKQRLGRYLLTLFCFSLALMAKPTVVITPLLLLLLDYWPLQRLGFQQFDPLRFFRSRVFLEKIPLFVLSAIASGVTLFVQRHTVEYSQSLSLGGRLGNAAVSYAAYAGQLVWPANLTLFYRHAANQVSAGTVWFAATVLMAVSVVAWTQRERQKVLLVGWLWFLVALLPTIGIIQVGIQGRADRYTYLPHIGLLVALVWWIGSWRGIHHRSSRYPVVAVAGVALILLGWKSYAQTSTWRDTETLWRHALAVDEANEVAHNNLAVLLIGRGEIDEAVAHYQAALRSVPEIENHTQLSPAIIHNSLGNALVRKGDIAGAIAHYRSAVALRPEYADAHVNLAAMLRRQGNLDAAIAEYRQVVTGPGEDAGTHEQLAAMLTEANRLSEAAVEYRRALEIAPDSLNSLNALAWILAGSADQNQVSAGQALLLAERANRLTAGRDPIVLRILAACYAGTGRPTEAASTAERALSLAGSNHALVSALQTEVARYKSATGL